MFHSYAGTVSVGRVLQAISVYCDLLLAERFTVGNGEVRDGDNLIASYTWKGDVPFFEFKDSIAGMGETIEFWKKKQFVLSRYLDNARMQDLAMYLVQEVRRLISLEDALQIRFVRDTLKVKKKGMTGLLLSES